MIVKVPEIDPVVDGGMVRSGLRAGYSCEQCNDRYFHLECQRHRKDCIRAIDPRTSVAGEISNQADG